VELGLSGKNAWVSGATQGLGRAIADGLASEGVNLFITARDESLLAETAGAISAEHGVQCLWRPADYLVPGEATAAAEEAGARMSTIDILVNNAGTSIPGSLETPPAEWASSNQLNFLSHLEAIRSVLPGMKKRSWGRIINISGFAYRQPREINTGTIAKYALINTSKVLSREVAPDGITVNTVAVGLFGTPRSSPACFRIRNHAPQSAARSRSAGWGNPGKSSPPSSSWPQPPRPTSPAAWSRWTAAPTPRSEPPVSPSLVSRSSVAGWRRRAGCWSGQAAGLA
jgi:3-oxoacyl-[acyl-carrier protein] reductase